MQHDVACYSKELLSWIGIKLFGLQFEQAVIPEAQKAKQLARRNVDLDEANAKLSAQVQVSNEKAKRCLDSVHKWQGQFDDEKAAHG